MREGKYENRFIEIKEKLEKEILIFILFSSYVYSFCILLLSFLRTKGNIHKKKRKSIKVR